MTDVDKHVNEHDLETPDSIQVSRELSVHRILKATAVNASTLAGMDVQRYAVQSAPSGVRAEVRCYSNAQTMSRVRR